MFPEAHRAIRLLRTRPLMTADHILMAEKQLALAENRFDDTIKAFEEQLRPTLPGDSVMHEWRASSRLGFALSAEGEMQTGIALLESAPPAGCGQQPGTGSGAGSPT